MCHFVIYWHAYLKISLDSMDPTMIYLRHWVADNVVADENVSGVVLGRSAAIL